MNPRIIETLEHWNTAKKWLKANGYKPWQYGRRWNDPDGLEVNFMKAGHPDIVIITKNEEVHNAIYKYNSE